MSGRFKGVLKASAVILACSLNINVALAADEAALIAAEAALLEKVEEGRAGGGAPAAEAPKEAAAPAPEQVQAALPAKDPAVEAPVKEANLAPEIAAEEKKIEKISLPDPKAPQGAIEPVSSSPVRAKKPSRPTVSASENSQGSETQRRLEKAQQKINGLVAELDQTRNRLLLAETEVERLSAIIEDRNKTRLQSYNGSNAAPREQSVRRNRVNPAALPSNEGKVSEDMPIATVVVDKAHLRTGPGLNNSPLMTVSQGTRLAVETRMGDWYRIISPTGTRAWVASDVVAFGLDGKPDPSRTVRVKGYDSRLEDKAFDLSRKDEVE